MATRDGLAAGMGRVMRGRPALAGAIALAVAGATATAGPAAASTVMQLSPAELAAGADRVVEAQVTAIDSRWSADHLGLETIVTLLALDGAGTFTIVQPGGTVGEATELVFGMPVFHVGDRARYHLAHNVPALWLDGQPTWRVYGWAQGVWPERVVDGVRRFVPGDPRGADLDTLARDGGGPGGPGTVGFAINGMVWPADRIPVGYELHQAGSADLTFQQVQDTVRAAFDAWEHVPCSSLAFHLIGTTDLPVAVDGHNVISFIESGWVYGAETAGATSLFIIDGMQTADVAMNGENYTWAIGPPGALQTSGTLDLQAVLTHELGHFSGLGHTMVAHDTMYYSWTPWQGQRTPSADDKRGLCSIYPVAADECTAAGTGCPAGTSCVSTDEGRLCDTPIEPIGSACNYDHVECGNFCLFTSADLSSGYCSRYCSSDADCPATHHCDVAMAGGEQVKVCFAGAQPVVDAGPSDGCTLDDQCAAGQYCTGAGACSFDCRTDDDCPGSGVCDDHGRCAGATGDTGGGCCGASPDPRPSLAAIALGLVAGLFARGRRSRRPARSRVVR